MKLLTVIGTRPQFIKSAMVSKSLNKRGIEEIIVHTGQHYDENMSRAFFDELGIAKPSINLGINRLTHSAMTGRMLEAISETLTKTRPDGVIVYGDSNTTLAGALATKQAKIPLIHIEAGLRSSCPNMPEEINRTVTDRVSNFLFCPTNSAVQNLKDEGYEKFGAKFLNSGDVMLDAAMYFSARAEKYDNLLNKFPAIISSNYILCTFHREENTEKTEKLTQICEAINLLSTKYQVVIPLHPRTYESIRSAGIKLKATVIPPVGYFEMNLLARNARLILTDSGGLQKEAYFFNKYCILLRSETEWVELVNGGFTIVVGTEKQTILEAVDKYIDMEIEHNENIFGSGHASVKIVNFILEHQDSF